MANVLFNGYKSRLLNGGTVPDWDTSTIRLTAIDTADDDPDPTVDDFYDDIAAAARVATANLASVTVSAAGVVDAADTTFSSVTGDQFEELLLDFDAGGAEAADLLLVRIDTASSGLPATPNSGDIDVQWNAAGILAL